MASDFYSGLATTMFDPSIYQNVGTGINNYGNAGDEPGANPNLNTQAVRAPNGQVLQKNIDANGKAYFNSGFENGKRTQYYQDPGSGQWMQRQISEESGGLIRGVADTVVSDPQFMGFLAVSAGAGLAGAYGGGAVQGITAGTGAAPGTAGATLSAAGNGVGALSGGSGLAAFNGGAGAYTGNAAANEMMASEAAAAVPGSVAADTAAAGLGGTGSWLSNLFGGGSGGAGALSGLFGSGTDLLKNAGSLALMYKMYEDQKGNAQEWRNFMGQSTPDKGFYEGRLKQTYEDPGAWLNGPEYQAAQAVTHNKLQRSDAAGGRLANDFGRQQQLQDHAMASLQGHQKGLQGLVTDQQRISTGQASGALQNAQAAEGDWMKNVMNWLNSQGK